MSGKTDKVSTGRLKMNKKLIKALATAAILVAGVGGASAADFEMTDEYIPVWDGFYGGFGVGYGWADSSASFSGIPALSDLFRDGVSQSDDAPLSSIHLGYMKQSGNIVYGGQLTGYLADFSANSIGEFDIIELAGPSGPKDEYYGYYLVGDDDFVTETSGLFTATGRLGFASGNTLFFASGGLASAEISTHAGVSAEGGVCIGWLTGCDGENYDPTNPSSILNISGLASGSTSRRHYGFAVGGGLRHKINEYLSIGAEYNYMKLESKTHNGTLSGSAELFYAIDLGEHERDYSVKVNPDGIHTVDISLSIHFQ